LRVHRLCRRQRLVGRQRANGVEQRVTQLDRVKMCLQHLNRRQVAPAHSACEFDGGQFGNRGNRGICHCASLKHSRIADQRLMHAHQQQARAPQLGACASAVHAGPR
jgi:hypothetical protein